MAAQDAVDLLIKDIGDKNPQEGFRADFAKDLPIRSFLQRQDKTLDEVLKLFDWKPDNDKWTAEYQKRNKNMAKLIKYRRRVCFCVGGWRELNEDFGRGDVSCLRDIRTPLVTARSRMKAAKEEFDDSE